MMWYISVIGVLCVASGVITYPLSKNDVEPPLVTIGQGDVSGSVADDGEYFEFYGIPYADTTAGSNRFKAPLPPKTFTETFIANRKEIKCVRPIGMGFEGSEDCLVANVFTPTLSKDSKLPVMVWVKGKELSSSNGKELSFKHFVTQDVVVVTLNFRESILGYLCLGTETAPGNAGLKDIIAGLKWIKQNIEQFGGNPDDVTLIGHGSGAAAVDLITLSPLAEGLVHKAIAQSGNSLSPWAVSRDNLIYAVKVAEELGHTITNIEDLSEIFTRVSVPALMAAINELDLTDNSLAFAPCIEREDLDDVQPFMLKTPFEIISEGEFLKIPFITGFVDKEGTIRSKEISDPLWLKRMDEYFADFLQADLIFENDNVRNEVIQNVRKRYFEDQAIDRNAAITYHGDTMILVSAIRETWLRSSKSTSPIYLYQFSYKGALGEPFVGPIDVQNAAHSEELAYLFNEVPLILETDEIPDTDLAVSDLLQERWTNFVKTGNPTSGTSQVVWQPFNNEAPHYLRIVDASATQEVTPRNLEEDLEDPYSDLRSFWNEIYEDHFLDAQSNWDPQLKDDDDATNDDSVSTPSPEGEEPISTPSPPEGEESVTTPLPDGEGEDGGGEDDLEITTAMPDSASTAVGYTFMIISVFALVDKFHSLQLLN